MLCSVFKWLLLEAIRSSETSVLTEATQRHTPEDGILHSHRRENLKFYNEECCLLGKDDLAW
jgi:hypothetical protein